MISEVVGVAPGQILQRAFAPGGHRQHVQRSIGQISPRRGRGGLFENDVRIGATKAERSSRRRYPPPSMGTHGKNIVGTRREPSSKRWRIERLEVQVRRDRLVLQRQTALMSPAMPARGLQVADVRLHGADGSGGRAVDPVRVTAPSASISIGSPSDVPVPWAST